MPLLLTANEVLVTAGVPMERYLDEQRVALSPAGAESLIKSGLKVVVERGAGATSTFTVSSVVFFKIKLIVFWIR